MTLEPDVRRQLAQQGRLWALALACATVGAVVVWRSSRLAPGVLAFLAALIVLGPLLWVYERAEAASAALTTRCRIGLDLVRLGPSPAGCRLTRPVPGPERRACETSPGRHTPA